MSQKELEERVAILEEQVRLLLPRYPAKPGPMDWLKSVGMFTGDEAMKELDAECLASRERERQRARASRSKRRSRKK